MKTKWKDTSTLHKIITVFSVMDCEMGGNLYEKH